MNLPQLVLGSRNRKKSAEIAELLAPFEIQVRSVADFEHCPEVVEDGDSFAANAALKATQVAKFLGQWVLAEDSGIMIDALNGRPGIYSARYSGDAATDESNNAKMLEELANVPDEKRGAQYVCHVCLSDPQGQVRLAVEATCRGRITQTPKGTNGFGYDPYFLIPEYHRTFGELSSVVKQRLSHRARAFERFIPQLVALFRAEST
jgi:XTP/dITP diphosphohydrolase